MNRKIKFSEGEYYHIYNRGVDKRDIFMDKADHDRFLLLLSICNSTEPVNIGRMKDRQGPTLAKQRIVSIGAWCMMPNHFHLLVKEEIEGGISMFLHRLSTGYSMYFNKRYVRTGSLFGSRFQAKHADSDEYLKYLYSYIHLNPVKLIQPDWKEIGIENIEEAREFLNNYNYSSYKDYSGNSRVENEIINAKVFPEYFESPESFHNNIFDWLSFNPENLNIK